MELSTSSLNHNQQYNILISNYQARKHNVVTSKRNGGNGRWMKDIRLDLHGSEVDMNRRIWWLQRDVLMRTIHQTIK